MLGVLIKMANMLLLFNHSLTDDQKKDAIENLGIHEFVVLPDNLRKKWKNVPPNNQKISRYLEPFRRWVKKNSSRNDYILIQGDFGAVYSMVNYSFLLDLIPVYATTQRDVVETKSSSSMIRTERKFKHVFYRRYERGVSGE